MSQEQVWLLTDTSDGGCQCSRSSCRAFQEHAPGSGNLPLLAGIEAGHGPGALVVQNEAVHGRGNVRCARWLTCALHSHHIGDFQKKGLLSKLRTFRVFRVWDLYYCLPLHGKTLKTLVLTQLGPLLGCETGLGFWKNAGKTGVTKMMSGATWGAEGQVRAHVD